MNIDVRGARLARFAVPLGAIAVVVGLAYVATQVLPFPTRTSGNVRVAGPGTDTATGGDFELTLQVPRQHYRVGETIEPVATLSYSGQEVGVEIGASGGGPLGFGVEKEGGPRIDPAWDDSCSSTLMRKDTPMIAPFAKSGGWADDDPHAAFLEDYFHGGQALVLPQGTWQIWGETNMVIGGSCGGELVQLVAMVTVVVEGD